eukprot:m.30288 g.30288  ORF g.30288 m.30288 type:complete len:357 (+) comp41043_c0_seq1:63-1133(+)
MSGSDVEVEADLQQYLAQHNIEHLLKDIVVKLCLEKPTNPLKFIAEHVSKLNEASGTTTQSHEEEAPKPRTVGVNRRGAVSADVIDQDDAMAYEKKVIPKDAATMISLQKCVSGNVLFASLEQDELTEVLDAMFLANKETGDVIMKQGDDGDNFYCIDKGTVEVWISKDGGEPDLISEITDGGSFGELALIYGTPRAATIKAKTPCTLWAIDRDSYRRVLMGSVIRKRKMYEVFLEKVDLLKDLDKWERLSIADALEPAVFKDTQVVMRQGDEADCFYLIVEGKAVVTQTNGAETKVVNELGPSQYFGEMGILNNDPRKATVTASGDLKCAKLDRQRFERLLGPCEEILRRNMQNY